MTKFISVAFLILSYQLQSQIIPPTTDKVYFNYDEGGNQILRYQELISSGRTASSQEISTSQISNQNPTVNEDEIWNNITIYPVPVKEFLNITWNEKIDDLITHISLYEQNTLHWVFQNKKVSSLNRTIKINMSQQHMGVYVLTFVLKDGRRISKNITKK